MTTARRSLARDLLLAVCLFALGIVVSHFTRTRAFEGRLNSDEPEWIAISILHWRQFVLREPAAGADLDPSNEREASPWKRGVQHTTFGYMNPCLPKLVWGAAFHAAGYREASPLAFQVFHKNDPGAGKAAQDALLPAESLARAIVVGLAALSAVLLFFVARALCAGPLAWLAGALAFALWFASPLVQNTSGYIRTDFFMLPPCLAALLLAVGCDHAASRGLRAHLVLGLALGCLCGLALSSKLNGGLLGVVVAVWLASFRLDRRGERWHGLAACALAGLVATAIFYALDPRLWGGPIDGLRDILARWDRLIGYFQDELAPKSGVEVARSLTERLSLFARKTFARDEPIGANTHAVLGAAVVSVGFALLVRRALERREARARTALVFVGVFVAGTALWLPLDWERFYLTSMPCLVLLEALAIAACVERVAARSLWFDSQRDAGR